MVITQARVAIAERLDREQSIHFPAALPASLTTNRSSREGGFTSRPLVRRRQSLNWNSLALINAQRMSCHASLRRSAFLAR